MSLRRLGVLTTRLGVIWIVLHGHTWVSRVLGRVVLWRVVVAPRLVTPGGALRRRSGIAQC